MEGPAVSWMLRKAAEKNCVIMGSMVITDDGKYFNRLVCAAPDGTTSYYDKRHLFSYAGEDVPFTGGNHRLVINIQGWRVCPMICYDLRFPVWSRSHDDYDVLVFVANWPTPRIDAWETLLKARAIENLSYVVAVNRIGTDDNNNSYSGRSQVIDYGGRVLAHQGDTKGVLAATLDYASLRDFRSRYNFLADKDAYILE